MNIASFILGIFLALWLVGPALAAPRDGCTRTLPKERTGYWHYRIIKGQKCWYQTRRGRLTVEQARPLVTVVGWDEFNEIDAKAPERNDFELRFEGR